MEQHFQIIKQQPKEHQKQQQCQQNSSAKSHHKDSSLKSIRAKMTQSGQIDQYDPSSQARIYYNMIFSSNDTAKSLELRNQAFQAQQANNQLIEDDPGIGVYLRRKKRLEYLYQKESEQIKVLDQLKNSDPEKFEAIIQLLKFFSTLKQKVKVDYYSHKTFCAIKSSSAVQINKLSKVLQKIYKEAKEGYEELQQINQNLSTDKESYLIRQFLIIPRFLISRQKIQDFNRSQQTQDSFRFLVQNLCLGHQNNQANKKMPQKQLITLLTQLLSKQNGKQIFKTICSINHGNKYKLDNGNAAYIQLFSKDLQSLKNIDRSNKKIGKKSELNFGNSTLKSKSNIDMDVQSDEDFLPINKPIKTKSKLKSRLSLNYQAQSPQKQKETRGKFRVKQSKSLHVELDDLMFKSQIQIPSLPIVQQPNFKKKQKAGWSPQQKLKQNIILVFPRKNSDQESSPVSPLQMH